MKLRLNSAKAEAQASSLSLAELGNNLGFLVLIQLAHIYDSIVDIRCGFVILV